MEITCWERSVGNRHLHTFGEQKIKYFRIDSMLHVEVDETREDSTPVSQVQESETTVDTGSLKCRLVFFQSPTVHWLGLELHCLQLASWAICTVSSFWNKFSISYSVVVRAWLHYKKKNIKKINKTLMLKLCDSFNLNSLFLSEFLWYKYIVYLSNWIVVCTDALIL